MEQHKINQAAKDGAVNTSAAHSPLIVSSLIFFAVGSVLSAFSIYNVMSIDSKATFLKYLIDSGIVKMSALTTWLIVYIAIRAMFALLCVTFTAGLGIFVFSSLKGSSPLKKSLGMSVISSVANGVRCLWLGLCGILAVIFVYKLIAYIIANINPDTGIIAIFSMILFELVCLALFALVSFMLVKFCKEIMDMCDALTYIFVTGSVCSISPAVYKFFLILGGLSALLAFVNRNDSMALGAFLASGAASVLFGIWIQKLKSQVEWIKYVNSKNKTTNK